jgi:hypothetical protein
VDVLDLERRKWLDARDSVDKDVMEDVAYDEPPETFGRDVDVRTLNEHNQVAFELGDEPEDKGTLLCDAAA